MAPSPAVDTISSATSESTAGPRSGSGSGSRNHRRAAAAVNNRQGRDQDTPSPPHNGTLDGKSGVTSDDETGGAGGGTRISSVSHAGADAGGAVTRDEETGVSSGDADAGVTRDAAGSKKRKTGPGSRGVAHLTPEQLAKKRANDREAQRAIRKRQRLRNEHYEREIRELKSQQPYQELQAAVQQTAAVQAEVDGLKRVLASVVAMIEPILGRPHHPIIIPGQVNPGSGSTPTSVTSPGSGSIDTHGRWHEHSPQPPRDPTHAVTLSQHGNSCQGLELGPERLEFGFVLGPNHAGKIAQIQSGVNGAQDSPQYRHVPMKHDWTATAAAVSVAVVPGQTPPPPPFHSQQPPFDSEHATPSTSPHFISTPFKNSSPTCPLDSLLLDFLSERRQRAAEGLSPQETLGPRYPCVSSLLNPTVSRYSHPLSKVFTDILACFPDLAALPERVAVLYVMFLIMRWQVSPTPENYDRLPEWVRAIPAQCRVAHPAWIDHIPFPKMRERLIGEYAPGDFPFENFFIPFTSTLNLNWGYEDEDVLLRNGDEISINPVFERHLRRLQSWTLGDAFAEAFPGLDGTYNLRNEGGLWSN